ncbi:sialidase family protein [Mariniphaga sediminis]|uniref:sialidase family protein n=1 Tax=Mariniphaga sediminis TaxID=1628158 RepID=UPI003562C767
MKRKQQILAISILLTGFIFFGNDNVKSQNSTEQKGKITTTGYWIHDKAEELPGLKTGPFVRLDDKSILTIEKNMSCISKDEGKTWTKYSIFPDSSRFEIRIERVLFRTSNGTIILAFANDKERANWSWNSELADSPGATIPTYAIRSLDGGKTWQDLQKLHDEWTGANRDIIETKDGNIIFTSMMMRHNPGHHTVVTYTSKTNGFNWIRSNVIDLGGVGHHSGVTEATIEQLNDGRVWMLMRTNWGVFWEAYSEDEGLTWGKFKPTKIDASSAPGLLQRLQSGRLFLIWNRVYPEGKDSYPLSGGDGVSSEVAHSNNREELSIMFSDDDGETWSEPVVVARITPESKVKRLAYPRVFEARPGEIWITTTYSGFGGYLSFKLYEKDFI